MNYNQFIESKRHTSSNSGIDVNYLNTNLFDYQKYVTEYLVKKGRSACFLDTGLGKTLIELNVAENYVYHTKKPVLIITPLAVAYQFINDAEKFNISDISYSKQGKIESKIVVCNYERLQKFNPNDFDCVILDESSILKNFEGKTKETIIQFIRKVKYRFLFSASPSPNDYIELGNSSEALGYLGYVDMLGKYFKNNNNSIDARHSGDKWYLKPHAKSDFWYWVAGWSISARKPSDIGFTDEKHILPELKEEITTVKNDTPLDVNGQMALFNSQAVNFFEIKKEVRATLEKRCNKAVELASNKTSVYWVNLNDEAKQIKRLDSDSVEIEGSMSIEKKEDILMGFQNGDIKRLITKPSITSFGLNWQHCNHTVYFPTYSFEQYYQAVRRFYRFGQKKEVTCDLVISDGQKRVLDTLLYKKQKADEMFSMLIQSINNNTEIEKDNLININLPKFI